MKLIEAFRLSGVLDKSILEADPHGWLQRRLCLSGGPTCAFVPALDPLLRWELL